MPALRPSDDSALVLELSLPPGLEALRLRHVHKAVSEGVPAHLTLLYPFAEPSAISPAVRAVIAGIAAGTEPWMLTLAGFGRWPNALYATVVPDGPVRALQGQLAAAFASLPLYGRPELRFEPHVTIVEGPGVDDPSVHADPAWSDLPVDRPVDAVSLIVREAGRWKTVVRLPLGGSS